MNKIGLAFAWVGVSFVPVLSAVPAAAQLDHTYVSQTGSGSTCSFAAPCGSVTAGIAATNDGGDLYIINGDYTENVTITKGISIQGEDPAGVIIRTTTTDTTSTAITINAPGKNVQLHNLSIYGDLVGVQVNAASRINIASGTSISSNGGFGLQILNSAAGIDINMNNVSVSGNTQGNILFRPSGSVGLNAFMNNVRTRGGLFGVRADASLTSGTVRVVYQDGWVNNAQNAGFLCYAPGTGFCNINITRAVSNNNGSGVTANGANARALVTNSTITHNTNGLNQLAGSELDSFGDNEVRMNTNNTVGTITPLTRQ